MKFCLLIFVFTVTFIGAAKLPPQLKTCHLSDKDLDHCLIASLENLIKNHPQGIPELNVPSLDPVEIDHMVIGAGPGAVHLVQNYKDVQLIGYSNLKSISAHLDFENKQLDITTLVPEYLLKGTYNINGKILVLPVYGNGTCFLKLSNGTFIHKIQFEETQKNGENYFNIKKYSLRLLFTRIVFRYENLFNGNKILSDNIHQVLNENWEKFYLDVQSGFEEVFRVVFENYASRVFSKVPIKDIFPK